MSRISKIAAGAVVSAFVATAAFSETFEKYGEVEGWKVFIDNEKMSCLIEKFDEAGNVVQMGLTADRSVAYVGVFTKGNTGLKKGEEEAVAILVGENLYVGKATGMRGNITKDYSGGYVLTDDPQFVEDIAKQYTMSVFPEKQYGFTIDLTGTYKAIEMARECNQELLG
jgi:hypothetical protein